MLFALFFRACLKILAFVLEQVAFDMILGPHFRQKVLTGLECNLGAELFVNQQSYVLVACRSRLVELLLTVLKSYLDGGQVGQDHRLVFTLSFLAHQLFISVEAVHDFLVNLVEEASAGKSASLIVANLYLLKQLLAFTAQGLLALCALIAFHRPQLV